MNIIIPSTVQWWARVVVWIMIDKEKKNWKFGKQNFSIENKAGWMSTHNSGLGIELKTKRNMAFAFQHESKWSQKKMWNWRKSVGDWDICKYQNKFGVLQTYSVYSTVSGKSYAVQHGGDSIIERQIKRELTQFKWHDYIFKFT